MRSAWLMRMRNLTAVTDEMRYFAAVTDEMRNLAAVTDAIRYFSAAVYENMTLYCNIFEDGYGRKDFPDPGTIQEIE